MALDTLPNTWTLPVDPGRGASQRIVRVDASRLQLGLFVTELDRPWMDTPFLIQGFLVDSAIELSTLQRYCRFVFVDPERSTPEAARAIRDGAALEPIAAASDAFAAAADNDGVRADPAVGRGGDAADNRVASSFSVPVPGFGAAGRTAPPAPYGAERGVQTTPARSYRIRADVRITRETRDRFRRLVRGERAPPAGVEADTIGRRLLGRLRSMIVGNDDAPETLPMIDPALDEELTALAGDTRARDPAAGVALPLGQALPGARAAALALGASLAQATRDIREQRRVSLESVATAVDALLESSLEHPDALLWVVQSENEDHAQAMRAAALIVGFGCQLRLSRRHLRALGTIGLLADIGKCLLPRALLEKPGMLNPAEYSIVKEHVRLGLEALGRGDALDPLVSAGIAQHHERLDGSGYPKGLDRSEIGLHGRMAAIVDSFSALCAPRAYANALAPQDALMSLFQWSESSFDTALVEQFVHAIGVFPVGTLVELSTGEIAAVVAQDRANRLAPRVVALTDPDKRPRAAALEVPIGRECGDSTAMPTRVVRGLPCGAFGVVLPVSHPDEAPAPLGRRRDG
ncbi:MAG: DUF3391 domain-containing protein [Burkholderiaceae bacterium]|nr:DUF3391 domain-containing protein [Burkholderiaceae bacterium]